MAIVKHQGSSFWYYSFQLNGKKYFRSTKTTNKVTARQIEAKAYEQAVKDAALGRESPPITLGEAMAGFIASREGTSYHKVLMSVVNPLQGSKRCNKTKKRVKVAGLDFSIDLHMLKTSDLNRLVEARRREGSADNTIKQHVLAVGGAIKWAKSMGYLVDDAIEIPSFKRVTKTPMYLTPAEEARLLAALDPTRDVQGYGKYENRPADRQQRLQDQYDFVIALLDTGLRYQECAQIEWKNVDLDSGVLFYNSFKADKRQTVHLSDRVIEMLRGRHAYKRADQQYVFENDNRTSHRPYHNMWLNRTVERAGIDKHFTFHKFRSTYASKLVQAGVPLFEVSQLLNHSDPSTTLIYAALVPTDVSKKAANVLNKISGKVSPQA